MNYESIWVRACAKWIKGEIVLKYSTFSSTRLQPTNSYRTLSAPGPLPLPLSLADWSLQEVSESVNSCPSGSTVIVLLSLSPSSIKEEYINNVLTVLTWICPEIDCEITEWYKYTLSLVSTNTGPSVGAGVVLGRGVPMLTLMGGDSVGQAGQDVRSKATNWLLDRSCQHFKSIPEK